MSSVSAFQSPVNSNPSSSEDAFAQTYRRTDRMFAILMLLQGIALIVIAVKVTPRTWSGTESSVHAHVIASVSLGILVTGFPAILAWCRPGALTTRLVMAAAQMMVTGLLTHIAGGRVELHFHAFVSLAFLASYLDVKVIVVATLVVATDHVVRGVLYPQSIFGDANVSWFRITEHALWVIFEDVILVMTIVQARAKHLQMHDTLRTINQCVRAMGVTSSGNGQSVDVLHSIDGGLLAIRNSMLALHASVSDIDQQTAVLSQTASSAVDVVDAGVAGAERSKERIRRLNESIDQIAAAISEINVIAEQTRLLALNATIEAARSNASGAGFAVVARQVKELSVKASVAANRISKVAKACVSGVGESLEATDALVQQFDEVRSIVRSTDETIGRIRKETSDSSTSAARIAHAFNSADGSPKYGNRGHAFRQPADSMDFCMT